MYKYGLGVVCLAAMAVPLCAQQVASMRATMRGGGSPNGGKCTIEVNIDDIAEVEISGDTGRIRTLTGQPSQWRRFECSGVMPARPADFRFQGIDGRGRVQLVRDPRQNRGVAVVRIEDSKGGREGYTFDLIWQGGGFDRGGDRGDDRRDDRRDDRGGAVLTCSSDDMHRHYCDADTRNGVRLVRQRSDAQCRQNYSWGYDRRGIWVDRGCRADFETGR
ncbi:MAG TPA: DUF3011 domain-containing protein [Bryobacteraceae bacterium]|jgi:hypothetical protein|nr:DUF3011 domain-containing protein [Bryobacteraceae bacterium]